jgi:hypothetical protein
MTNQEKKFPVYGAIIMLLVFVSAIFLKTGFTHNSSWYWGLTISLPLIIVAGLLYRKKVLQKPTSRFTHLK